jgi:adenylate cyclase class 1
LLAQKKDDISFIKNRFFALNRERMKRTQSSLRWKQRDFLDLLPLLFHINNPLLPGYISQETPAGIPDYNPNEKSIAAAKRLEKTFQYKRRALRTFEIASIFLMGSTGTVTHSDKSDFDIWLCYNPNLTDKQITALQRKASAIEQWAKSINLEVHFFLMDAEKFKAGTYTDLSNESSGSAQHHLLLEEFYRTSLLIGGRYPIWWLVPSDKEKNYEDYISHLIKTRQISSNEYIDFGSLAEITSSEFFGAALWQMYKGIDSPYKSVLKILIMETYAQEYPNIDFLSSRFKRAVYAGETNISKLDPYLMLYSKLEEYLTSRDEVQRLDLVRRCFYFKTNLKLSIPNKSSDIPWRRETLGAMVTEWGWNETMLEILDDRESWKIHRVQKERKILVDELTNSYLALSDFARKQSSLTNINQSDLNTLGRKLYAAFERKAGKVELINHGIAKDLFEEQLSLEQIVGKDNHENWLLFLGRDDENRSPAPLKRDANIISIITWCHFNKIMNARTATTIRSKSSILNTTELTKINECFQTHFPDGNLSHTNMELLSKKPKIMSSVIFINVGANPLTQHGLNDTDIISNKTDALNYSGFSFNLALSFDLVIETSWEEVLTFSFSGENGLLNCIRQYMDLNASAEEKFIAPPLPHIYSFSTTRGEAIAKRIEALFSNVISFFSQPDNAAESRYIFESGQSYYILENEKGKIHKSHCADYNKLIEHLSEPLSQFTPTQLDPQSLRETLLPVVFGANKQDTVQLFFRARKKESYEIYIIDESGSLFSQELAYYDDISLVNQYDQFLDSISNRQKHVDSNENTSLKSIKRLFFKIIKPRDGKIFADRCKSTRGKSPNKYFNVQVIGNCENDSADFTIYCNEKEFSSFEHGNDLFREVAKHVLNLRKSGQRYPIYITDIDLSPSLLNDDSPNKLQTINFLNYKKRIEDKLNKELEAL